MLVLISLPAEKKYFGYCFVTQPPFLSLLSVVGLIKWLSLFCKDILRFVSYLLRCMVFFVIMMRVHQEGGRVQDRDGFQISVML